MSSWRSLKPCELGARYHLQFEAVPQDGAAGKGEDLGGEQHHARRTWRPLPREVRGRDSRGFEAEQLQPWKVPTGNCLWPARAYICWESKVLTLVISLDGSFKVGSVKVLNFLKWLKGLHSDSRPQPFFASIGSYFFENTFFSGLSSAPRCHVTLPMLPQLLLTSRADIRDTVTVG